MLRHLETLAKVKTPPIDTHQFVTEFVKPEHDIRTRSNMLMGFLLDKIAASSGRNSVIYINELFPILKENPEILNDIKYRCGQDIFSLGTNPRKKFINVATATLLTVTQDNTLREKFKLGCSDTKWKKICEKLQSKYESDKGRRAKYEQKNLDEAAMLPVKKEEISQKAANWMSIEIETFLVEFYKPHSVRVRGQMLLAFILRKIASKNAGVYRLAIARLFPILQKHPDILADINHRLGDVIFTLKAPRRLNITSNCLLGKILNKTVEREFKLTLSDADTNCIREKVEAKLEYNQRKRKKQSTEMDITPAVTKQLKTTATSDSFQSLLQQPALTFFSAPVFPLDQEQGFALATNIPELDDNFVEMMASPQQVLTTAPSHPGQMLTLNTTDDIEPLFPDLLYFAEEEPSDNFKI